MFGSDLVGRREARPSGLARLALDRLRTERLLLLLLLRRRWLCLLLLLLLLTIVRVRLRPLEVRLLLRSYPSRRRSVHDRARLSPSRRYSCVPVRRMHRRLRRCCARVWRVGVRRRRVGRVRRRRVRRAHARRWVQSPSAAVRVRGKSRMRQMRRRRVLVPGADMRRRQHGSVTRDRGRDGERVRVRRDGRADCWEVARRLVLRERRRVLRRVQAWSACVGVLAWHRRGGGVIRRVRLGGRLSMRRRQRIAGMSVVRGLTRRRQAVRSRTRSRRRPDRGVLGALVRQPACRRRCRLFHLLCLGRLSTSSRRRLFLLRLFRNRAATLDDRPLLGLLLLARNMARVPET